MEKEVVNNLEETKKLAIKFASTIKGGEIILLSGDLGAGKTTFVQSVLKHLNVTEPVTSPTFTILKEYFGKFKINHFDMYRLEDYSEAYEIGFEDYLVEENAINFIEWPDKVAELLPKKCININITLIDENKREFIFS